MELRIVVSFRRPLILRVEELVVFVDGFIFMLLLMLFNIFLLTPEDTVAPEETGFIFSKPSLLYRYLRVYFMLSLCLIVLR